MSHIIEAQRVRIDSVSSEFFHVERDEHKIETAALAGYQQMQRFLQTQFISEHPCAWTGGRDGGMKKLGRTTSVHAFDLAQTQGAIRNRFTQAILGGLTIEAHKPQKDNHLPLYEYIQPDLFDLVAMEASIQGALAACKDNPRGREVDRARFHIQNWRIFTLCCQE